MAVEVENRGVTPFYYDWPVRFALIAEGKVVNAFSADGKLTGLLPGDPAPTWREELDLAGVKAGRYELAVGVPNPMAGGKPLRFANKGRDEPGWLPLGKVVVADR